MRTLLRYRSVLILLVLCTTGIVGWTIFRPQAAPVVHPLDQVMPEGALLYLEAKDFSALLKDWNASPERAAWLKTDDYRVFSNSRLFLRLGQASDQFAAAAGLPPNMKFLLEAAGRESAVAVYEIGKLEFLYITHLSSGDFVQSTLWQSRNKFQPRNAGGKPFFVRKDEESGRVVAFAVVDNYLVLGTREDLVAGSLELMSGSKGRALSGEGWYKQARAAAPPTPGDLRMVMNLADLAITPHFRTYWIQQNITEMQGYGGAVSDLYREGRVYREERVILPAGDDKEASGSSVPAVTALLSSVPPDYGFYQAGPTDAKRALAVLQQKILVPRFGAAPAERLAPQVQLTSGQTGSGADLETRIDVEPASRTTAQNAAEAFARQLEKTSPQAVLIVQASRKNTDGVLLSLPAVVGVAAGNDWDVVSAQNAVQEMIAPGLTAARLGLQWREVKDAGGYYELDGLSPLQMAVRGKVMYLANDAGLLTSVLQTRNQPLPQPASYAAGFSHARERQKFYEFTNLVDQPLAGHNAEPQFFSQNMASFSRAFAKLESEEIITRQTKDKIQQTVTYRWMQ
jgi:hypothetical protein